MNPVEGTFNAQGNEQGSNTKGTGDVEDFNAR
jgi:hypothetical protein